MLHFRAIYACVSVRIVCICVYVWVYMYAWSPSTTNPRKMLIIILLSLKFTHNEFTIRILWIQIDGCTFHWSQKPITRRTALICQINFRSTEPNQTNASNWTDAFWWHKPTEREKKKNIKCTHTHIHTVFMSVGMFDLFTGQSNVIYIYVCRCVCVYVCWTTHHSRVTKRAPVYVD